MRVLHFENKDLFIKSVIYFTALILMADKDNSQKHQQLTAGVFDDVHVLIRNSV